MLRRWPRRRGSTHWALSPLSSRENTMSNLVMVMPYQAYIRKAQNEGFRITAIWDPAEAHRLYGAPASQYLRDVEALADGFRLVDFTDRPAYAEAIRAAVRES